MAPLLALAACSNPFGMPGIEEFSASPDTLSQQASTAVTLTWRVTNADSLQLSSDRGLVLDVSGSDSQTLSVGAATTFTLTARSLLGAVATSELSLSTSPPDDPPGDEPPGDEPPGDEPPGDEPPGDEPDTPTAGKLLILIAGQSNAGGRGLPFPEGKEVADDGVYMLSEGPSASDWGWVRAEEPTDTHPEPKAHSFAVRLGNELKRATGLDVYLVQAAVGGTGLRYWLPGGDTGYFDNAVARARFAAADLDAPVSAVAWFQGESDTQYASERDKFSARTVQVFEAFHDGLPGAPPILFVQLAKRLADAEPERNLAYQTIREMQRVMDPLAVRTSVVAPGGGPGRAGDAPPYFSLVVSHDLDMSDELHVGSAGQKVLGSRLAHAFLVEFWDGQGARSAERRGPRLVRIERAASDTLRVLVSRPINDSASYDGYFGVFIDGTAVGLAAVGRDPANASAILLRLSAALPTDLNRIAVRYMPPDDVERFVASSQSVHAVDESGLVLPLPAFGGPGQAVPSSFLQSM